MKTFLILLGLLAVAYYLYTNQYFSFHTGSTQKAPVTAAEKAEAGHSFDQVCALLQSDMDRIPIKVDGSRQSPSNAFEVKRKLLPHVNLHSEYGVLVRVCDIILAADAQRSAFQQASLSERSRVAFHSSLDQTPLLHQPTPRFHSVLDAPTPTPKLQVTPINLDNEQSAAQERVDDSWSEYRSKAASEVSRLLDSLKGKRL